MNGGTGTSARIAAAIGRLRSSSMFRDTANVTAVNLISRVAGFLIPFIIAAWFGVTEDTDVFFFAYGIALFVTAVFAPVLETVIVPFISSLTARNEESAQFTFSLMISAGAGSAIISLLLASMARLIVPAVTGFPAASLPKLYLFLYEMVPLVVFGTVSAVLAGVLNARREFLLPAVSPSIRASVNIATMLLFRESFGIHAVMLGFVIGEAARMVLLGIRCFRAGYVRPVVPRWAADDHVAEFARTAVYQVGATTILGLVPVVDKAMASWLGAGQVSMLEYAYRLFLIPITLLGSGVVVTALTYWSDALHRGGLRSLKGLVSRTMRPTALVAGALSLGMLVGSTLLVRVAYGYGGLSGDQLQTTARILFVYSLWIVPYVIGQLYNRALIAVRETRFLMFTALVVNVLNGILNVLLMARWGATGIAAASVLTSLVALSLTAGRFRRLRVDSAHDIAGQPGGARSVSVIVVTYNSEHEIGDCVASVVSRSAEEGIDLELIVVDNDSSDSTLSVVAAEAPGAIVVQSGGNLGFSIANNLGIRQARGDWTLILNPDTILDAGCLTLCLEEMESKPWIGLLGCRLYNDLGIQRSWYWPHTLGNDLLRLTGLLPLRDVIARKFTRDSVRMVGGVVGAFMLVRTDVIRELGGFDESLFMYGEDVDLCYRFWRAGLTVGYLSRAGCFHVHNASGRRASDVQERFRRHYGAIRWFYSKHQNRLAYKVFTAVLVMVSPFRYVGLAIAGLRLDREPREARLLQERVYLSEAFRDLRGAQDREERS